ncbi:MAG: A/G-specific adenine glycosylase [Chloroflexi bacterium]|nr:A/G-specific adenine glycosylase [Chloroflexota bacterium]
MPESRADLHAAVLDWYTAHGRPLAFRATSDPWAILVSEVMAQQTQAARAAEAWSRFMTAFPTPITLAAASPAAVVRAWRGLGYNRRALALRDAAVRIVERHAGVVPAEVEALEVLPGVGPYTARAVAALAYGRRVGPVDTNVRRVLGRAFFDGSPGARELQVFADEIVPERDPGTWSHALMDIGAQLCRPRLPRCDACPLMSRCRSARSIAGAAAASRRPEPRFEASARWLRGRIIDQLRDAADGAWVAFDGPIGQHGAEAIDRELDRLARDGLLERHPEEAAAARLVA